MSATLAYVGGDAATITGVDIEGQPFVASIARGGVVALGRACWDALVDMDRAPPIATTDDPPVTPSTSTSVCAAVFAMTQSPVGRMRVPSSVIGSPSTSTQPRSI